MFQFRNISLILCLSLLLTGCWDSKDIEQLGMEVGAALDKAPPTPSDEGYRKQNIIKLTVQKIDSKQKEGDKQKKYENISGTGDSIVEIFREFSLKQDNVPYGAHLKVLVIGENLAKERNLQLLLNLYLRTFEVRDSCNLLIAHGSAANTLKIKGDVPAFILFGIDTNKYKTARLLPATTIGKAGSLMASKNNFIIQSVSTKNGKVKFKGGAVFKGKTNKLIGFLSEEEVVGLNFITGNINGGALKGKDPKTNQMIVSDILSVKSKVIPHIKGNHISFNVSIESSVRLNEDWVLAGNSFSNKFLQRVEIAMKEEIKRLLNQTLHKLQKEYQVDVAGFDEQLRIHYPKEWEQIKPNWNKRFKNIPIKYEINVTVKDYMLDGKKK
ncbi:Ger(x)C family spore germination protein [Shimazuella kribbensis]|uniref:Ger(x)C family spore germination protein n=1 Tax=Shimazuella kribbensis TaxID=139808 RepID=UPI00040CAC2F|nr:Ger(x)C family spore germination protein [Shimazuella kribbensis]